MNFVNTHSGSDTKVFRVSYYVFIVNALLYPALRAASSVSSHNSAMFYYLALLVLAISMVAAIYMAYYLIWPYIERRIDRKAWDKAGQVRQYQIDVEVNRFRNELERDEFVKWCETGRPE